MNSVKNQEDDVNEKIRAVTLDELFSPYNHINLVKMDVKGSELTALRPYDNFQKIDIWIIEIENENQHEINGIMRKNGLKAIVLKNWSEQQKFITYYSQKT